VTDSTTRRRGSEGSAIEDVSRAEESDRDVSSQARDIVVIGASAGGLEAIKVLVTALPSTFSGSVFIVIHLAAGAQSTAAKILDRASDIEVTAPADNTPIVPGRVYVSSPDRHMLLESGRIRIVRGPKENRHRPAIDPLFRSAAWAYGPRVVGVVLSGSGDDGTAGLWAIKSCGGTTVVQDPAEAAHSSMPENALKYNSIDHRLPIGQIAPLLIRLSKGSIDVARDCRWRQSLKTENEFDMMKRDITDMDSIGKLSPFTCPSCRGALWELRNGDLLRYRCHTGHAFSEKSLRAAQSNAIEESLYSALRAVEEKATLLRKLSDVWHDKRSKLAAGYEKKADALERSAEVLRRLLPYEEPED